MLVFLGLCLCIEPAEADTTSFAPGLDTYTFSNSQASKLILIGVDPQVYDLKLMTAASMGLKENLSARQWAEQQDMVGAINAGMYQTDYRTAVGLLIADGKTNNRSLNGYKSVLAFDPTDARMPAVQIIDRQCQDFGSLRSKYRSLLQGIRMISCQQTNTWSPGGEKTPIAALGMTKQNRILFVFARQPTTPHELGNTLLALPIGLQSLMYLEGGPPAQFYLKAGKKEIDLTGSYSNAAQEAFSMRLPIPNVLGIVKKKKTN